MYINCLPEPLQCILHHLFNLNAPRFLSASCFFCSISSAEHRRLARLSPDHLADAVSDVRVCFRLSFEQVSFSGKEATALLMTGIAVDGTGTDWS